jgi:hypothetical protein
MSHESKKKYPNETKLREAVVDVLYEFKMFGRGAAQLDFSSPTLGNNDSTASMGLSFKSVPLARNPQYGTDFQRVEGLLIHFRNLLEFFYEKKGSQGLVLASHYTGIVPDDPPEWASKYKRRCDVLLAHLTFGRTHLRRANEHHWKDIPEKVALMQDVINKFLESLPDEKKHWFESMQQ